MSVCGRRTCPSVERDLFLRRGQGSSVAVGVRVPNRFEPRLLRAIRACINERPIDAALDCCKKPAAGQKKHSARLTLMPLPPLSFGSCTLFSSLRPGVILRSGRICTCESRAAVQRPACIRLRCFFYRVVCSESWPAWRESLKSESSSEACRCSGDRACQRNAF